MGCSWCFCGWGRGAVPRRIAHRIRPLWHLQNPLHPPRIPSRAWGEFALCRGSVFQRRGDVSQTLMPFVRALKGVPCGAGVRCLMKNAAPQRMPIVHRRRCAGRRGTVRLMRACVLLPALRRVSGLRRVNYWGAVQRLMGNVCRLRSPTAQSRWSAYCGGSAGMWRVSATPPPSRSAVHHCIVAPVGSVCFSMKIAPERWARRTNRKRKLCLRKCYGRSRSASWLRKILRKATGVWRANRSVLRGWVPLCVVDSNKPLPIQ